MYGEVCVYPQGVRGSALYSLTYIRKTVFATGRGKRNSVLTINFGIFLRIDAFLVADIKCGLSSRLQRHLLLSPRHHGGIAMHVMWPPYDDVVQPLPTGVVLQCFTSRIRQSTPAVPLASRNS